MLGLNMQDIGAMQTGMQKLKNLNRC
ncbi:hypothetical protein OH492_13430 [Vibrio chagasii]|nr:hypothetical protein [Vibrio chagasii]